MDVIALKVTGASVAIVLVVLQGLIMLQLYGRAKVFPLRMETLRTWHRRQGDVLLVLFLLVAYNCVTKEKVDWGDWRSVGHAVFGIVTITAVVAKLLMVQVFPRTMKYVTPVGLTLFVAALGATGTTVFWYFYLWLVQGTRPGY